MNASETPSAPPAQRPRRWLKRLLWLALSLGVLMVVAYFVVTSTAFLQDFILPRVSQALGAQVTVERASIHPFSSITLHQLQITPPGAKPLLTLAKAQLRYRFSPLLSGHIEIDELSLDQASVHVHRKTDGTSNLDPFLAPSRPSTPTTPSPPSAPTPFVIRNVAVRDLQFRYEDDKAAAPLRAELQGVTLTLDRFETGQPATLDLAAQLRASLIQGGQTNLLHTRGSARLVVTPGPDLLPTSLNATSRHEVLEAVGRFEPAGQLVAEATLDFQSPQLKNLDVRFRQPGRELARLHASGPIDLNQLEANIKLEISPLDRSLLNLVGAPFGLDFAETRVQSAFQLGSTRGGALLNLACRLQAEHLGVRLDSGASTPPVDLQLGLAATVDPAAGSVRLSTLTLEGTRNRRRLLQGSLSQPLAFNWNTGQAAPPDASVVLDLNDLQLADWRGLTGPQGPEGTLNASLTVQPARGDLQTALRANLSPLRFGLSNQTVTAQVFVDSTLRLGAAGTANVLGTLGVTNLVLQGPESSPPTSPLNASLKLDAGWQSNRATLRFASLALPPTAAAPTNVVSLSGKADLLPELPLLASFQLRAQHLDLTPLLDALPQTRSPGSAPSPAQGTSTNAPAQEPDALTLPLRRLELNSAIQHLVLREISLSNWAGTVILESNRFVLQPCSLTANGAAVNASAEVDFSQPGWRYQLGLQANSVPIEPWVNSFMPEYRGRYEGDLVAHANVRGAGVTAPSLRSHLAGQLTFAFTNAEIHLLSAKAKRLLTPIATVLRIGDIDRSPLNWLALGSTFNQGTLQLDHAALQSAAFEARTRGALTLADTLDATRLNLPVEFALRRSLAQKANLLPQNTPADTAYVALPPFITLQGTVGDPRSDLDERRLGGVLLKSGIGIAEQLGVKTDTTAGAAIQGLGDLLTGQKPASGSTNAPGTNAPQGLLDLLRKKK